MTVLRSHPEMQANGFKAFGNSSTGYLLISDSNNGRRVYIDQAIAGRFAEFLASNGHKGKMVMSRLSQLRATAGGMKSFSSLNNAFEHMDIVENLQIGYKITQPSADDRLGGVYITRIDFAEHAKGHSQPGLYSVDFNKNSNKWELDKDPQPQIHRTNMAVNGLCEDAEVAARDIMPDIVNGAYKDVSGSQAIKDEGFGLFYNPRPLYSRGKHWKTPEQKQVSFEVTANKLGNLMLAAQTAGKATQWVIHGDGCKLFRQTLLRLQGRTLDQHTVFFAAPKGDFDSLLPLVRNAGLTLHKDVFKYNAHDWSQPENRVNPRIAREIRAFGPGYEKAAAEYSQRMQSDIPGLAGMGIAAASAGWSMGVSVGVGSLVKAKTLRNLAANHANDPALNPHMHPFKSTPAMNAHINTHNGGEICSFLKLAQSLRREYV